MSRDIDIQAAPEDLYDYNLASIYIRDARYCRVHIPFKHDSKSLKLYELYYNTWIQAAYYTALWVNLGLIFFEEPRSFPYYIHVPFPVIGTVNFLCILYFLFHWLHYFKCSDITEFKNNKLNIVTPVMLALMVLDLIIYSCFMLTNIPIRPVQWSRALRPFLCATFPENYKIRSALNNIRGTLVDISTVFLLFLFMLIFFSIIALQFFCGADMFYPNGNKYFQNFFDSFFDLYVLVTTSNSPDVIIPAYETHRAYIIIYLSVTIVCNWIFIGIIVASVYNAYKTHLGEYVIDIVRAKKLKLTEAFRLLKNPTTNEVDFHIFLITMKIVDANSSEAHNILLFKLLDINKSNTLSIEQFTKLTEFSHLHFEEIPFNHYFFQKQLPTCYMGYMSSVNQLVIFFIRHKYTKLFFDFVIVLNAMSMIIFTNTKYEIPLEWCFTMMFVAEAILRLSGSGVNLYFRDSWNIFDFVVISLALFSLILHYVMLVFIKTFPSTTLRVFLALRILRILKLITGVKDFKIIIHCIVVLIPSLLAYAAIQLSIYYIYICIGMEAFGNRYSPPTNLDYNRPTFNETIDCGNSNLVDSDFIKSHYCILNFNSAADGFLLMTILTVSNNWHILLTGATLTTSRYARIFFLSIHWMCVLLVMNIVLAFIIDAYLMEIESSKGHFEEHIESRLVEMKLSANEELKKLGFETFGTENFDLTKEMLIKAFPNKQNFGSVYFRLNNTSPKEMETLLQRMFEDDIAKLQAEFFKYSLKVREERLGSISLQESITQNVIVPSVPITNPQTRETENVDN